MKTDNTELYESMPVNKAVLLLAVPTVISQLITVIYNMADTFFIGHLNDPNQVAAATIAMPVFMFLTAFANLFGIGGSAVISRALGAGDKEKARRCASFCIWTAAASALLYGVILYSVRGVLLPTLGTNSETYDYTCQYVFWTIAVGAVPTVMNSGLAHLVRSEGYAKQASIGVAFGGLLNIVLDPVFIFTLKLEITGAAVATMLSNAAVMVYFFVFLYRIRKHTVITPNPGLYTWKEHIPSDVLAGGLPSFVMTLMSTLSNAVLNSLIATYSNEAVAGIGIAKKIDLMAFAIAQGMTQGVLSLIAYNYASGNRERMKSSIRTAFIYSFGVAFCGMLFLLVAAEPITALFINDADTIEYGHKFLRIVCLACPTTALNFMIITIFQATSQKIQSLALSFLRKGTLDIPIMFLMNCVVGVDGIMWATPIADMIALIVALMLFVPFFKKINIKQDLGIANKKK